MGKYLLLILWVTNNSLFWAPKFQLSEFIKENAEVQYVSRWMVDVTTTRCQGFRTDSCRTPKHIKVQHFNFKMEFIG